MTHSSHQTGDTPMRAACERRPESGFTVVEVIIAMLIAVVVVTGLALAVGSAGRLQTASQMKGKMSAAAEKAYEVIRSDRDWMDGCAATCDLSSRIPADVGVDEDLGPDFAFDIAVTGEAIDSEVDGVGPDDADGRTPDYYEVVVVVSVPSGYTARFPEAKPFTFRGTLDRSGQQATGTLIVQTCATTNQLDMRSHISGCDAETSDVAMTPCIPSGDIMEPCLAYNAVRDRVHADPSAPDNASAIMRLQRVATSAPTVTAAPGTIVTGAIPAAQSNGNTATWIFRDIPVGTYNISLPQTTGNLKLDPVHMIPANGTVGVNYKSESQALAIYEPVAAGEIDFEFTRTVRYESWVDGGKRYEEDFLSPVDSSNYTQLRAGDLLDMVFPEMSVVLYTEIGESYLDIKALLIQAVGDGSVNTYLDLQGHDLLESYYLVRNTRFEDRRGAAGNSEWWVVPRPAGRYAKPDPSGEHYEEAFASTTSRRCGAGSERGQDCSDWQRTLRVDFPGLNSSVQHHPDTDDGWAGTVVEDTHGVVSPNVARGGGANASRGYTWLDPDGSINGGNPRVRVHGAGECIFTMSAPTYGHLDKQVSGTTWEESYNTAMESFYNQQQLGGYSATELCSDGRIQWKDGFLICPHAGGCTLMYQSCTTSWIEIVGNRIYGLEALIGDIPEQLVRTYAPDDAENLNDAIARARSAGVGTLTNAQVEWLQAGQGIELDRVEKECVGFDPPRLCDAAYVNCVEGELQREEYTRGAGGTIATHQTRSNYSPGNPGDGGAVVAG